MIRLPKTAALTALAVLAACSASSSPQAGGKPEGEPQPALAQPVVIELYQSQGCSSCPPALVVLDKEADRPGVIALNFAVTYWDQLGWKDQFARPEYTARQWDYARAGGRKNVQTPQLIVNGRQAVLGSRKAEVDAAIVAARMPGAPTLAVDAGRVAVGGGQATRATVWVVDYDPRALAVPIGAGENTGRTLVHRNIVKRLTPLGAWTGKPATFAVDRPAKGLARVLIVQQDAGGPILAARKV